MTDVAGADPRTDPMAGVPEKETPAAPRRILIVCTANQCRSPMAEGLLKQRLAAAGMTDRVQVSSAGTWARKGVPATPSAVLVMAERGVDIGAHRSREVGADLLAESDLVLVMTQNHAESLTAEFPDVAARIQRFGALGGAAFDIADPVGRPPAEYRATADELTRLIDAGWAQIIADPRPQPPS